VEPAVISRIIRLASLVLLGVAILIALLPASVGGSLGSIGCNSAAIAQAENLPQTSNETSYDPAIFVWINPSSAVPANDPGATQDTAACGSAAQNHMIPALVLFGLAVVLSMFGDRALEYVRTGHFPPYERRSRRPPPVPPSPSRFQGREVPGYFDPTAGAPQRIYRKSTVRLTCQHLEEMIGDPSDLVGRRMLCRTCGPQQVESVLR
jgi:hypothetical protein